VHAALVGLDLGPNLSVSGSLATLLWLIMLRREGVQVTPWQFLRIGTIVTIPSLALALLAVR
jgi:arsenical pump membrane protein